MHRGGLSGRPGYGDLRFCDRQGDTVWATQREAERRLHAKATRIEALLQEIGNGETGLWR